MFLPRPRSASGCHLREEGAARRAEGREELDHDQSSRAKIVSLRGTKVGHATERRISKCPATKEEKGSGRQLPGERPHSPSTCEAGHHQRRTAAGRTRCSTRRRPRAVVTVTILRA